MEAKERALTFLREQCFYVVPYFQRGYVWDEDNWDGIWQELTSDREESFLGSIILKEEKRPRSDFRYKTIIDGQQRLTTLSILLRAFFDYYSSKGVDFEALNQFKQLMFYSITTWGEKGTETTQKCRIIHSRLDSHDYYDIIEGRIDANTINTNTDSRQGPVASKLLRCYKYFCDTLLTATNEEINRARQKMIVDSRKILVVIDLSENDNEQIIFDAINSTGVKLTASDIIKNTVFQKVKETGLDIERLYKETWAKQFENDPETVNLWLGTKGLGQNQRSNIDLFFYSFAIIKGFFQVPGDKMSDLATKYKEFIKSFSASEIESFVREICEYAKLYKETFIGFDSITGYNFNDWKTRLLQILDTVNITAFNPYILYALKEFNDSELQVEFNRLERYVLRHYIIGNSTKMGSFLSDAVGMINGVFDMDAALSDDLISDNRLEKALRFINNNKAKLVLFWIELKRHTNPISDLYNTSLNYSYELEHIMPQQWGEFWSVTEIPVFNYDGQQLFGEEAKSERSEAVYEIGNMTLLTSKLNKKLRNYSFAAKVNGARVDKKDCPGIKEFAALSITKDVINRDPLCWNEASIHERTNRLIQEFKAIWPAYVSSSNTD